MRLRTRLGTLPGAATILGAAFLALALSLMTGAAWAAETAEGDVNGLGSGAALDVGFSEVVPLVGAPGIYRLDGTGITTTTSYSLVRIGAGGVGGSVGLATVDGANTMLTISNFMDVGNSGLGRLIVSNGGRIDTLGGTNIGGLGGATGYVLVSAGQLNLANGLTVGNGNFFVQPTSGTLVVTSGGAVSVTGPNGVTFGWEPMATGVLTVDGGTSLFATATDMTIGRHGTGTVAVTGGGAFSVGGDAYVGQDPGSHGSVLVSGAGSQWTVDGNALTVGQEGAGQLVVADGGSVTTTAGQLGVGSNAGGQGSALVAGPGSQLTVGSGLLIGQQTSGALTVADGGSVTVNNGGGLHTHVGLGGSGTGTLLVAGTGSQLQNAGQLIVGNQGSTGHVVVRDGGALSAQQAYVGFNAGGTGHLVIVDGGVVDIPRVQIGFNATGSGSVVVRGSGAKLQLLGEDPLVPGSGSLIRVGSVGGHGNLLVEAGGQVELDSTAMSAGNPAVDVGSRLQVGATGGGLGTGVGTATITGPTSAVTIATAVSGGATVQVGRDGSSGTLNVLDGASVTVNGPGSVLNIARDLASTGTVNILRGGQVIVTSTNAAGVGRIARDPGTLAAVTVDGAGSLLQVPVILTLGLRNNNVPPAAADQGGSAVLTLANGGTVRVNPDGSGIVRLGSGDILKGNGVIEASLESYGGTVEPGLSAGIVRITGGYVGGPGSRIILEVGNGEQDTLIIGGAVQLDPTSSVAIVVSEQPPAGTTAPLIQTDAGQTLLAVVTTSNGDISLQQSPVLPPVPTTIDTGGTVSIGAVIDIKPGDATNTIKAGSGGVVPVAILSNSTFHAPTAVNPDTVRLAGAKVKMAGKSDKFLCGAEDVNHDGVTDLVCHVITSEVELTPGSTMAVLNAQTFGGQLVTGSDAVRVIP